MSGVRPVCRLDEALHCLHLAYHWIEPHAASLSPALPLLSPYCQIGALHCLPQPCTTWFGTPRCTLSVCTTQLESRAASAQPCTVGLYPEPLSYTDLACCPALRPPTDGKFGNKGTEIAATSTPLPFLPNFQVHRDPYRPDGMATQVRSDP